MTNNKSIFRLTKAELSQMAGIGQEFVQCVQMVQSQMKTARVLQQECNRFLGDAAKKRCEIVAKTDHPSFSQWAFNFDFGFPHTLESLATSDPKGESSDRNGLDMVVFAEMMYSIVLWSLTMRVWNFSPRVIRMIKAVSDDALLDAPVPVEALKRMPDICPFFITCGMSAKFTLSDAARQRAGFFAFREYEPELKAEVFTLHVMDTCEKNLSYRFVLDPSKTLREALTDENPVTPLIDALCEKIPALRSRIFERAQRLRQESEKAAAACLRYVLCLCLTAGEAVDLRRQKTVGWDYLNAQRPECNYGNLMKFQGQLSLMVYDVPEEDVPRFKEAYGKLLKGGFPVSTVENFAGQLEPQTPGTQPECVPAAAAVDGRKQIEKLKEQIANLESELVHCRADLRSAEFQVKESEKEVRKFVGKLSTADEAAKAAKNEADILRVALKVAEKANLEQQSEIDRVLADSLKIGEENKALKAARDPDRRRIEALTAVVESLRAENAKVTADADRYRAESKNYLDLYLSTSSEHTVAGNEVVLLRDKLTKTEKQLDKAQEEIAGLSNDQARLTALLKAGETASEKGVQSIVENSVFKKCFAGEKLTAEEVLTLTETVFSDRVVVLPSAKESAARIDNSVADVDDLRKLVFTLVTDYLDVYLSKGDAQARLLFGSRYAAQESDSVMKSSKRMRDRIFSGITMTQHLKVGFSTRLYFMVDTQNRKVLIGYCGEHLNVASTN